ncbi:hypothetical protein BD413DRAFT_579186 [Trametes elegans]|nr:hypothetical protein BD413DRAFT_579186 [Trametes elegans]
MSVPALFRDVFLRTPRIGTVVLFMFPIGAVVEREGVCAPRHSASGPILSGRSVVQLFVLSDIYSIFLFFFLFFILLTSPFGGRNDHVVEFGKWGW